MDKNRGYWCVDNEYYDNKVKAIIAAQHRALGPDDITYHYNDQSWNKFDWSQEPDESLQELYVARARQLREKYKTLILRFSSGADSTNILRIFVDNNIKLDVVAMNEWHLPGIDPMLCTINIEKKILGKPLLEKLLQQGAKFQVVVNNFSSTLEDALGDDPAWIFDIDAPKFSCIDITAYRALTTPEFDQWDHSTTGVIVGVDKPRLWCSKGKIWYFSMPDTLHSMHNVANNMIPEPFYWTADMPEIVIKQSHVVKQFWKNHLDKLGGSTELLQIPNKKQQIIPLIYPSYYGDIDPFAEKLPYNDHEDINLKYKNGNGSAPRGWGWDWQFHKSPYFKIWKDGINLADRLIDRQFKDKDSIWENGLKPYYTKPRWIGK